MMLTLNHKITPETLKRVATHIPAVLQDYNDYLLLSRAPPGQSLKFLGGFRGRSLRSPGPGARPGPPFGATGDRMEVKQSGPTSPGWWTRWSRPSTATFGIYLRTTIRSIGKLMKEWEIKAFGKDLKSMVQQLASEPTVMGQKKRLL